MRWDILFLDINNKDKYKEFIKDLFEMNDPNKDSYWENTYLGVTNLDNAIKLSFYDIDLENYVPIDLGFTKEQISEIKKAHEEKFIEWLRYRSFKDRELKYNKDIFK